jgi:hypothetical protein
MDMVEDLDEGEGDGDSVSEEALLPGLMLAWEEEDCRDVAISSAAEPQECPSHRLTLLMAPLGLYPIMEEWLTRELCHMVMPEHLWGQCQERTLMLSR